MLQKETDTKKILFSIISRGIGTPVQSLTVNSIFRDYLVSILNTLVLSRMWHINKRICVCAERAEGANEVGQLFMGRKKKTNPLLICT